MTVSEYFQRIPLFADLSDSGLAILDEHAQTRAIARDTWLFHQYERGDACYIVLQGTIRLVVEHGSSDESTIGLLGPNAFFGELSLLEPEGTRAAGALAVVDTTVLEIPVAAFDLLVRSNPQLAFNVLRRVATNLRRADDRRLEALRQKNRLLTEAYTALEQAQAEALRRARVARELELGRELQRRLAPTQLPEVGGVEIAVASFPAYEMSGDFYEARAVGTHQLNLLMADVCDKGPAAAQLMALAKGMLLDLHTQPPLEIITRCNRMLRAAALESAVITMVYAQINVDERTLRYVRAGHDWPLYFRAVTGRIAVLEGSGMPLGVAENAFFEELMLPFGVGDALILYTDGLCDARNAAGDAYGRERLIAAANAYGRLSAQGLADAILGDVRSFQSGTPPIEDLTLLVAKLTG